MPTKNPLPKREAIFIESMECLPVPTIPEGPESSYEIKLDGYRIEAVRRAGETTLFSRKENVLNKKFGFIAEALSHLPDGTFIDGELVALDATGRPDFNLLQNFRRAESQIRYFIFDNDAQQRDQTSAALQPIRCFRGLGKTSHIEAAKAAGAT